MKRRSISITERLKDQKAKSDALDRAEIAAIDAAKAKGLKPLVPGSGLKTRKASRSSPGPRRARKAA